MTMMIAKYERGKSLNVRTQPNPNAPVVRRMVKGEEAECFEIREGWAKLKDGFANAAFLIIKLGEAVGEIAKAVDVAVDEVIEAVNAATDAAQADEPAEDDEAAALRKMTNPQLYDLAEQSGIKVKKGAKKEDLIAAILADE